ncbi:MAG: hypothetical protein MJZ72_05410 [Bacteroidales bacterium]|nr:hypothetical protein [Bacteroidales bacterium]
MKEWMLEHKDGLIRYGLLFIAFFIGLMLPSPFFRNEIEKQVIVEKKQEDHVDQYCPK